MEACMSEWYKRKRKMKLFDIFHSISRGNISKEFYAYIQVSKSSGVKMLLILFGTL